MADQATTEPVRTGQGANDPIGVLERAVADVCAMGAADPGELESELPRIRAAEYALMGLRLDTAETCAAARRDALHQHTQRLVREATA